MTLSIRTRLTLWFTAAMVVALTAFSVGVVWLHGRWARAQFDAELATLATALSKVVLEELSESGSLKRAVAEARTSMDVPERAMAVLDTTGGLIAAKWHGFHYSDGAVPLGTSALAGTETLIQDHQAWRVITRHESSSFGNYVILVAGPMERLHRQQTLLTSVLLVAAPLVVLMTSGGFWWVASSALRPMTTMAAQAAAITVQSEAWRLEAPATHDELGQLARAFNSLLDRLLAASQMQRQFMADASHELRTPVSAIQTAAEVTLAKPAREDWEYRDALTIVNEQSARLGRIVEDMMSLARADAGGLHPVRRSVYVDDIAAECVRAIGVVAAAREVQLVASLEPDISINGDDAMLHQLMTNLLDNAVRYTTPGGRVAIIVARDGASVTVTVSDTGPGIPPSDRDRVFDRFVRLDPARSATSGAGLGLPIARWIAEAHGGTLVVEENLSGGCSFVARLPLSGDARTTSDVVEA
jgi:two-component system, OmpR family, sensor kinase